MKNRLLKVLSIILIVCLLLSVCNIVLCTESLPITRIYFVSATGSVENDGLTVDTPLPDVAAAVAKCDGLGAEDNIIVKAMGATVDMGTWGDAYTATLTIESNDALSKTVLTGTMASYTNGPTVFRNIILDSNSTASNAQRIYLRGNQTVFDTGVEFGDLVSLASNNYSSKSTLKSQTIVINSAVTTSQSWYLPNVGHYNSTKYEGDFNFIVNNESAKIKIGSCASGKVTYQENLNFFIKKASSYEMGSYSNIVVSGALQFLVNSSTTIANTTKANIDAAGALATGGYYYVKVDSAVIDNLSLTEVAGEYVVLGEVVLEATNTQTMEKVNSADGYLKLPEAGEWNVVQYFPPVERNYYIDATNGFIENDGLSPETAVPTVADAVSKATDLDANDTIIANLIGADATMGQPVKYVSKLLVKSYAADIKTKLTITKYNSINGPTVFKNLTLNNGGSTLFFSGNDVTIESDVDFSYSMIAANTYNGTNKDNQGNNFSGPTESQTIVLKKAYNGSIIMSNSGHTNNIKFNDDANLIIDNTNAAPTLEHNTEFPNGEGAVTNANFLADFNYFFKNAKSVTVNSMYSNVVYKITGAFQVLANKSTTINATSRTNLDAIGALAEGGYYYLTIDGADNIDLTPTAGLYKVADGYMATAVNIETLQEVESNADGELALTAGEWDVTVTKAPETKEYYVMYGGTGDGRSKDAPAATVYDVIASVNEDLIKGDIANINVMNSPDWQDGKDVIKRGENTKLTAFATDGGALPSYEATLVIQGYSEDDSTVYLAFCHSLNQSSTSKRVTLSGHTIFRNISIITMRDTYDALQLDGNNVTFEDDVKYGCPAYNSNDTWNGGFSPMQGLNFKMGRSDFNCHEYQNDMTVTFKNAVGPAYECAIFLPSSGYESFKMYGDYELVVDNASATPKIVLGSSHGSGVAHFYKNLNVHIKSAQSVTYTNQKDQLTVHGAFQEIVDSKANYTGDFSSFTNLTITGGRWKLVNASGINDLINFTATSGTFKVKEGYQVIATNSNSDEVTSKNGILKLGTGEWTVTAVKETVYKDYFVKNGGTGDGRTSETPAGTVKQVIDSVNEDLVAGDIANIYIMQREDYNSVTGMATGTVHNFTSWTTMDLGGSMTAHSAKIVIKPYDPEVKTYITYNDKYWTQSNINFGGDTVFEDICIVDTRGNYDVIVLSNKNVKFGAGVSFGVLNSDSTVSTNPSRELNFSSNGSGNQNIELFNASSAKLWVASAGHGVLTRTGNVSIVIDNSLASNKLTVYWGMVHSSGSKTQNGNINILTRNAYSLTHALGTSSYGIGKHTINGAVQMITRGDVVVSGSPADFSDKVIIRDGVWDLRYVSDADDALDFTDEIGKFKIKDGYTATAITADGTKIGSQDGILTLTAGQYMVYVNDEFSNTGEEILVHKQVELDVETIAHEEKEDKLFVGWKNEATGEFVEKVATYNKGDVLVAVYVDYKANTDFCYEEAMTTEDGGLRFVFSKNKAFFAKLPEVLDMGALVLPTDDGGYYDLYLDEPVVKTWKWNAETKYDFTPDSTGKTPTIVKHVNVLEENEDTLKYTLSVTNLAENKYTKFYSTKGYIKYEDYNGVVNVLYTEQGQASLYQSSKMAEDKLDIDNMIITVSEKQYSDKLDDYYSSRTLDYGSGAEDDVYNIYSYGGMNIRDIVIDTGIEGMTETDIFFISDPHFNYISRKDITNGLATTLSSYRGRSWARDGWSIISAVKAVNFGASFDHIVMGGDAVDYISYGALDVTSRVFTQRAVNDNITMVTGNHEVEELSQADMPLSNILSVEERHKFSQSGWANDVYYSSRIINGKVMVIGLDNSHRIYWNSQLEPLNRDLQYARDNNLAVLIFQHVPMLTMNSEETAYKFGNTNVTNYFGTKENGKATDTVNMNTYTGYVGLKTDESTQEVYTLIRKNADIIKGVFHGHEHSNMYTEIVGLDANGNPTDARISQHGIAGVHYNAAMAIKIK